MEWSLDVQGLLTVTAAARLCRAIPVLNGVELSDLQAVVLVQDPQGCRVQYQSPDLQEGRFILDARQAEDRLWLRYWLEDLPEAILLDSFGIRFQAVENLRQYLCSGYFSWDGSSFVQPDGLDDFEPYETRPETGYGLTQILPAQGQGGMVIGFDRHDRFQHSFTFDTRRQPPGLTILSLWDQKERRGQSRCESERLVIFEHEQVEEGLRAWAHLVNQAHLVAQAAPPGPSLPQAQQQELPQEPALQAAPITGWCSWYNLYAAISEENLLRHLHSTAEVTQRAGLPMRVFQIDDGFTPEMGDWLEVKPQFPHGMQPLLDYIHCAGFSPGLWIAPFMVGNRSHLYQEHPDWVVLDRQTGGPLVQMSFYGEFRWHKRSEEYYILDATHPDAFAYLRQVFRTWRREWGCEYFKTDFMHFGAAYGPDRAIWHTPGATRIEVWRRVAEMIRQEIGDATWLGCGFPLWAAVGLVDGVRIGRDVGVAWAGNLSAQSLLRDQATRNFANQILWQADPDCVLLRHRFHHLTEPEQRSLALFAGMTGGVSMTSDNLAELSSERLELWKFILPTGRNFCRFPLLGQSDITYVRLPADLNSGRVRHVARLVDPVLVQVRQVDAARAAVLLLNSGETAVQYTCSLQALGLPAPGYIQNWNTRECSARAVEALSLEIAPHDSVLLFVSNQPVDSFPATLAGDGG